jgi:heat shock protein HslJ
MRNITTIVLAILIAGTIGFTACSTVNTTGLENTKWTLTSYGKQTSLSPALENTEVTAVFDSGEKRVTGSAGCNNYFAGYELTGNKLSISPIASTEMYCGEPAGLMDQEYNYLSLLQRAKTFQIQTDQLLIYTDDEQVIIFDNK